MHSISPLQNEKENTGTDRELKNSAHPTDNDDQDQTSLTSNESSPSRVENCINEPIVKMHGIAPTEYDKYPEVDLQ